MSDRTLFLCKPDAVERGLVGEIVGRLERRGLTIVAMDLRHIDVELATFHYAEHDGKPFFDELVAFITRGPLVAMVVAGGRDGRRRWTGHVAGRANGDGRDEPARGGAGNDPR